MCFSNVAVDHRPVNCSNVLRRSHCIINVYLQYGPIVRNEIMKLLNEWTETNQRKRTNIWSYFCQLLKLTETYAIRPVTAIRPKPWSSLCLKKKSQKMSSDSIDCYITFNLFILIRRHTWPKVSVLRTFCLDIIMHPFKPTDYMSSK